MPPPRAGLIRNGRKVVDDLLDQIESAIVYARQISAGSDDNEYVEMTADEQIRVLRDMRDTVRNVVEQMLQRREGSSAEIPGILEELDTLRRTVENLRARVDNLETAEQAAMPRIAKPHERR